MMISSQRYLDQETVDAKRAAKDYAVTVATVRGELQGEQVEYTVIVDGHHSLEAAKQDGVSPIINESDYSYQSEIDCIGLAQWLDSVTVDSNWYDVADGLDIF